MESTGRKTSENHSRGVSTPVVTCRDRDACEHPGLTVGEKDKRLGEELGITNYYYIHLRHLVKRKCKKSFNFAPKAYITRSRVLKNAGDTVIIHEVPEDAYRAGRHLRNRQNSSRRCSI